MTPNCCGRGGWFCKDLPQPTTDDIEFWLCTDEGRTNEDVYIEDVEMYVQYRRIKEMTLVEILVDLWIHVVYESLLHSNILCDCTQTKIKLCACKCV